METSIVRREEAAAITTEDCFSPSHVFIYTMDFLATLTLAYVAFTPSLGAVFGPAFRLWPLPLPVPGPIAAGIGFALMASGTWSERNRSGALGVLLFPVRVWLGRLIWTIVERPTPSAVHLALRARVR